MKSERLEPGLARGSGGSLTVAFEKLRGGELEGDRVLIYPDRGFKYVEQLASYPFRDAHRPSE